MLRKKLSNYNLILASGSPRRQEFFKQLDVPFTIQLKEIDEILKVANDVIDNDDEKKSKFYVIWIELSLVSTLSPQVSKTDHSPVAMAVSFTVVPES